MIVYRCIVTLGDGIDSDRFEVVVIIDYWGQCMHSNTVNWLL